MAGAIINCSSKEVLVSPQKINIGCKKYRFNKTIVFSFTSFLNTLLKKNPMKIKR